MELQRYLHFLFGLVREGILVLRPLTHGFTAVCYRLINNDYSDYYDALKTLRQHRKFHLPSADDNPTMAKYHHAMIASIDAAIGDLTMWYTLSRAFYGDSDYAFDKKRILPNHRKIIQLYNEAINWPGVKKDTTKKVKNRIQRDKRK